MSTRPVAGDMIILAEDGYEMAGSLPIDPLEVKGTCLLVQDVIWLGQKGVILCWSSTTQKKVELGFDVTKFTRTGEGSWTAHPPHETGLFFMRRRR